jgi:hypothetical protein
MGLRSTGFELTEEEAVALLGLCLTSPQQLDATSEKALRKLAAYCSLSKALDHSADARSPHFDEAG